MLINAKLQEAEKRYGREGNGNCCRPYRDESRRNNTHRATGAWNTRMHPTRYSVCMSLVKHLQAYDVDFQQTFKVLYWFKMSGSKADGGLRAACMLLLLAYCVYGQNTSLTSTGTASAMQFPTTTTPPATAAAAVPPATPNAATTPPTATFTPGPVTAPATPAPVPAQQPRAAGPAGTYNLNPFNTIISCAPFNILVVPGNDNLTYSVSTALNADVEAAVRFRVHNNTLYVGFNRSFETSVPVKVNITLPASKLIKVVNHGFGDIYLNAGFATTNTTLAAHGAGNVLARNLNTTQLTVIKTGVADVFAKGAISTANVSATGTGRVTLAGVQQSVTGTLDGIVNLFVDGATDQTGINVEAKGLSKVFYTQGKCTAGKQVGIDVPLFSLDLGLSSCLTARPDAFPRYKAFWSCGMSVNGAAMCTPDAEAAAAAAADSADISVDADASASHNTATSSASASSSSSSSSSAMSSSSSTATPAPAAAAAAPGSTPSAINQPSGSVSLLLQGPSDAASKQLSDSADIGLDRPAAAGRRLHKFLWLPPLELPTFTISRDDDDANSQANTVTVNVASDGSRSVDGRSEAASVRSIECKAQQQELYIPAR